MEQTQTHYFVVKSKEHQPLHKHDARVPLSGVRLLLWKVLLIKALLAICEECQGVSFITGIMSLPYLERPQLITFASYCCWETKQIKVLND